MNHRAGYYEFEGVDGFGNPILKRQFYSAQNYPPNLEPIQVNNTDNPDNIGFELEAMYTENHIDSKKRCIIINACDRTMDSEDDSIDIYLSDAAEVTKMAEWLTAAAKWMTEKKDINWVALKEEMYEKGHKLYNDSTDEEQE